MFGPISTPVVAPSLLQAPPASLPPSLAEGFTDPGWVPSALSVHSLLTQRLAASSGELSVGRGRERSEPGREGRQVGRVVGKDRERSWGTCRVGLCQQPSHTLPELSATSWVQGIFPIQEKPKPPALQADSLPAEPQGKPKNTGWGSLSLLKRDLLCM